MGRASRVALIAWRAMWAIPAYIGMGITFVSIAMARGLDRARDWWDTAN